MKALYPGDPDQVGGCRLVRRLVARLVRRLGAGGMGWVFPGRSAGGRHGPLPSVR